MGRKVMSKDYLLEHREEILNEQSEHRRKSNRAPQLTKKERKILGIGKDRGVAHKRHVRISASKVNIVMRLIREKNLAEARAILTYTPKAASPIILEVLNSAVANAVNNNDLMEDELYIAECYANEGPTMKRWRPRARGGAGKINKRTSHITVVVKERE